MCQSLKKCCKLVLSYSAWNTSSIPFYQASHIKTFSVEQLQEMIALPRVWILVSLLVQSAGKCKQGNCLQFLELEQREKSGEKKEGWKKQNYEQLNYQLRKKKVLSSVNALMWPAHGLTVWQLTVTCGPDK